MISANRFIAACRNGNIKVIRRYIAEGGDINAKDEFSWTALMWSAGLGGAASVRELISAGVDINDADDEGETALMYAAYYGRTDCLRELIAARADIGAKNCFGQTAFRYALSQARLQKRLGYASAEMLAEAGADIYAKDNEGIAAIDHCKDKEVKDRLIKLSQRHIKVAIKSAKKPVIIHGFDAER